MNGLLCMNCKVSVESGKGEIFAEVFVCRACHATADSFFRKLERELAHTLVIAREAIRVALIEGRFHLAQSPEVVSRQELFQEVLQLEAMKDKARGERA